MVPLQNGPEGQMGYYRDSRLPTKQIALTVEMELYDMIRNEAYKRRTSITEFLRTVLRSYFDTYDPQAEIPPPIPANMIHAPRPAPTWNEIHKRIDKSINAKEPLNTQV